MSGISWLYLLRNFPPEEETGFSEAAVLVPAARVRERIDLKMERVTIAAAMEELGLVSGERGPQAAY